MKYEIGEKEYTFNCKLRTCVEIKKQFKKNYNQVIEELDKMDVKLAGIILNETEVQNNKYYYYGHYYKDE